MKNIIFLFLLTSFCSSITGQTNFKIIGGNLKVTDDVDIVLQNTKWINNGALIATDGKVFLKGDAATTIEGNSLTSFYNLVIDKSVNNVQLGNNIKVKNQLILQSGLLDIADFDLNFGASGLTVFSNQNYILTSGTGSVIRQIQSGNSANFIVGDGSCTPMTIQNDGTTDAFLVRAVAEVLQDGTIDNTISSGVVNRTWHIEEAISGGSDLTLTAQWNSVDELTGFDRDNCYLSHFNGSWDLSAPGAAMGNDPYSISRGGISSLSPFAVLSNPILPVEVLNFQVYQKGEAVQLEWQTITELNNDYFEIQHAVNSKDFRKIGEVVGAGTTNEIQSYHFLHESPSQDMNYYRLQQVDFDGTSIYSDIRSVRFLRETPGVSIYPNPAKDFLYVQPLERFTVGSFILQDLSGRILMEQTFYDTSDTERINLQHLAAGSYFVRIVMDGLSITKGLVIH